MAVVSRRRHCKILIVICCVSICLFAWHATNQERRTPNDLPVTSTRDILNSNVHIIDSSVVPILDVTEISASEDSFIEEQRPQIVTHNAAKTSVRDLPPRHQPEKEEERTFKYYHKKSESSSVTPYKSVETIESDSSDYNTRKYGINEDTDSDGTDRKSSSLADYKDIVHVRREFDDEPKYTGSSEYDERPLTWPIRRHPGQGFSYPPDDSSSEATDGLTPPILSSDTDSSGMSMVRYPKPKAQETTLREFQITEPIKDPSLIIDTPGCKIPKLDPWDPTVKHLIKILPPYVCPGPPVFMRASPDGSIILNETVLDKYHNMTADELECHYQPIFRKHAEPGNFRENNFGAGSVKRLNFGVPLNEDHVGVGCKMGDELFEQYIALVRLKKEVEDQRSSVTPPTPRLNVILAGIDSLSKLNFLRHLPKTRAFLNEKMAPFEMHGYTKVGDNTFPNLVPMLTGHFVGHYWNESVRDIMFFDDLDFIWKEYAKKGYRTFYTEDSPKTGTFNYLKRGFYNTPTDYYFRPLALAMEYSGLKGKTKNRMCYNSQIETEIMYDYLKDFLKAMGDRPNFSFTMVSSMTHDDLNEASWADEPTVHLLEELMNMGALNNSLLVLFSDHGIRFGPIRRTYIGKFEERMPMMYVHVPKWFLDEYPQFEKNLRTNQNRLMTLFDIHSTMVHLLDLNKTAEERSAVTLGSSLFEEISPARTCEDANVLPHWCPCQTFQDVSVYSSDARRASQAIIDDINVKLEPFGGVCEVLEVGEIVDARVAQANDLVMRYVKGNENWVINTTVYYGTKVQPIADYLITLVAKPGGGVFEATVRHDPKNDSYKVLGISRISLYGNTSWCIESQKMKMYCYCKHQIDAEVKT